MANSPSSCRFLSSTSRRLGLTALVATVGCAKPSAAPAPSARPEETEESAASSAPETIAPPEAPLDLERGFVDLPVPEHEPALLFVPQGAPPFRLVVATHGAGGLAEFECRYWQALTEEKAFVACPRGKSRGPNAGFYYPDEHALEREVFAVRDAVLARYEAVLEKDTATYAGFSQGAILAVPFVKALGASFRHLVLIEGGYDHWSPRRAREFTESGGTHVLFACGTRTCDSRAPKPRDWLEAAGARARVVTQSGAGHTPLGGVEQRVFEALPWLWSTGSGTTDGD